MRKGVPPVPRNVEPRQFRMVEGRPPCRPLPCPAETYRPALPSSLHLGPWFEPVGRV